MVKLDEIVDSLKKIDCVEKVILFGSRARDDYDDRSDVDLAIVCPKATDEDWLHIVDVMEEFPSLIKIDIVRLDKVASSSLKERVAQEGKVLYESGKS